VRGAQTCAEHRRARSTDVRGAQKCAEHRRARSTDVRGAQTCADAISTETRGWGALLSIFLKLDECFFFQFAIAKT
jgi:hypothetical protein